MSESVVSVKKRVEVFTALRHRDFRLYWFGNLFSISGHQVHIVAQGWLVYEITGSALWLGTVGLVEAIPALGLTLLGGVMADKVDQRRLLLILLGMEVLAMGVLATVTAVETVRIGHILVFAVFWGTLHAFDQPARQAIFPHLIDRRDMASAVGLNSTIHPATRILGPAMAGIIIDVVARITGRQLMGAAVVLYLAAAGYAMLGLFLLRVRFSPIHRAGGVNVLRDVIDGVRLIWHSKVILFLIGMMFFNGFFGASYVVLLPVFAKDILGGSGSLLGFLFMASGVGALSGALIAASLGSFRRRGWLLFSGAALQGVVIFAFALSKWPAISLLVLPLAGVGMSLYSVTAQSTIHLLVPDEFRGRVMGIWGMTYSAVQPVGRMQAGVLVALSDTYLTGPLGRLAGAPFAVAVGGLLVATFAVVAALRNPQVRSLGQLDPAMQTPVMHGRGGAQ